MIKQLQQQINTLVARQKDLQLQMGSLDYINNKISDACYLHGASAAREVAAGYRSQMEQREAWREEFNRNETLIAGLKTQLAEAQAQAAGENMED